MTPKTIWFISKYYASPPNEGSGSTRAFLLMREIKKLGHETIIFTSSSDPYSDLNASHNTTGNRMVDGVKVWLLRGLKYSSSISISRIFSWLHFEYVLFKDYKLEESKPDVIIISSPSILTIFNGIWLKRKYKAKLIFEVRDIWPLALVEDAGMNARNPFVLLMGMIEKIAYKRSDGIVGTMPNLKQHVQKILGYQKRVGFAPMGICNDNLKEPTPLDTSFIETYIPKNKFLIVYAGTIGVANALEPMFTSAQSLVTDKEIHFLIVGDGQLLKKYQQEYGNLPNLTFAPKIKKSQVQSILSYASLLYFSVPNSEVWKYGQSLNKIIDYMIASKPILASFSGYPSMLDEAGCGIFVPANNPDSLTKEIIRLKNMPRNELMAMGSNGKQWLLDNRNYNTLAQNYLHYIQSILEEKNNN